GKGAENGILIKGAGHLQNAQRITTVVLDKTGTITKGKPEVTDIISFGNLKEEELLQIAATAEKGSEHPLGEAIVKGAKEKGLALKEAIHFQAVPGHGIQVEVDGRHVMIGNKKMMLDHQIDIQNA
ncbi:HAD family hydrolase, partial [Pseudomonas aeruginosa]